MGKRNKNKRPPNDGKGATSKGGANEEKNQLNGQSKDGSQKTTDKSKDQKNCKQGSRSETSRNRSNSASKDEVKGKPVNDPSWYDLSPEITQQVASVPWSMYVGRTYSVYDTQTIAPGTQMGPNTVLPGVILYNYLPWYGDAGSPTSALRVTTRAFYQWIRHKNAGRTNYEAADLMMYIMAMDSIYLAIAECKRVLRLANTYVFNNRNLSRIVLLALGLDPDDISRNYANYLARLNIIIAKTNTMSVPATFNLFKRRQVMGSVVLSDDGANPTQLIIPNATGWFRFNFIDEAHSTSSSLTPAFKVMYQTQSAAPTNSRQFTRESFTAWLETIEDMLTRVLEDEDMNIMAGDILKAYPDNLYHIKLMESNEIQDVVYDELLINQFRNADTLDLKYCSFGKKNTVATNDNLQFVAHKGQAPVIDNEPFIGQNGGYISTEIKINRTAVNTNPTYDRLGAFAATIFANKIISWDRKLEPAELIEATRLSIHYRHETDKISTLVVSSELGLGWYVVEAATYVEGNVKDCLYMSQWHQKSNINYSQITASSGDQDKSIKVYSYFGSNYNNNTPYAQSVMCSLNANPQFVWVTGMSSTTGALSVIITMYGIRSFTALLSQDNLGAMTDAATNALLYSEFIKTRG